MKKIVSSATLGGAPIYKSDLREIFNDELWDSIEVSAPIFPDSAQGVIMSGCVITPNAGTPANFDITEGIIALDGEYLRLPASTNNVFPQFIAKKAVSYETRVFADGTTNNFIEIHEAELVDPAPGSGQYIIIADFHVNNRWNMPWTSVTLVNGWTGSLDYRIVNGMVELKGQINGSACTSTIFSNLTAGSPSGLNCLPQTDNSYVSIIKRENGTVNHAFSLIGSYALNIERAVGAFAIYEDLLAATPLDFTYYLNNAHYRQQKYTASDL